jgi:hypothetical protein
MTRFRVLLAALALTSFTGCYNVTYVAKTRTASSVVHEKKMTFWVAGLAGDHDVPAGQLCPGGVARVHSTTTFVDGLLTGLTLLIYAPRTVKITCAQ